MKKIYLTVFLLTAGVWVNCAAQATLNLNVFIEGYYIGSGQMQPVVLNENVIGATGAEVDTITVELHDGITPYILIESAQAVLMTDGTATATFSNAVIGKNYYIAVKHRNAIQTWSGMPVLFSPVTSYDFTTSAQSAWGKNVIQVDYSPDQWAIYNGDLNGDENVDLIDWSLMTNMALNPNTYGYYSGDLNGDGNVDLLDYVVFDPHINSGMYSHHP